MALMEKVGYGQVEPNHLSAQRTGQIYAQLPADGNIEVLPNGAFLKYNYAGQVASTSGAGEFLLVYNEVKLYEPRHTLKDFAVKKSESVDGQIVPRLFKVNNGDIFTTNLADITSVGGAIQGKLLVPVEGDDDYAVLTETAAASIEAGDEVYQVVSLTNLPDGQPALKVTKLYTAVEDGE